MTPEEIAKLPTPETDAWRNAGQNSTTGVRAFTTMQSLERRLAAAMMALEEAIQAVEYSSPDDSVGHLCCCGGKSYLSHKKECHLNNTLAAIKEAK